MNESPHRTAKSARRRLAATLLIVLPVLGIGAYAVQAASKGALSIAGTPATQTVGAGQSATYTVSVKRSKGFTGPVTLSAGNLPAGAAASWRLSDGTTSNVVPSGQDAATLEINTTGGTPAGSFHPTISGTGGNLSNTSSVTLVVQPAQQANFALAGMPASQTVLQEHQASYTIDVNRSGGFSGAVNLAVTGLPKGVTALWSPSSTVSRSSSSATLRIQAGKSAHSGVYMLGIRGTGTIGGSAATRSGSVALTILDNKSFQVTGDVPSQLVPGGKAPLNLNLTNPYNFDLKVVGIAVALQAATSQAGCSVSQSFSVTQLEVPASAPITLPPGTKTLEQLGIDDAHKPKVEMVDQPFNQDDCKGAAIALNYSGSAGK